MLVRVYGSTLVGVDGLLVSVEVDAGRGLPAFSIVGRGDRVVNESRDRIRAAFKQCELQFPPGRVTVNLAPTALPKAGAALDLPIAVALAATVTPLPRERLERTLLVGELGLDGGLRPVRGALPLVAAGTGSAIRAAVVPLGNLAETCCCPGLDVRGASDLALVLRHLLGAEALPAEPEPGGPDPDPVPEPDLVDVRGQENARRALEIAAAGGHNLLLCGPPGSGKTLLARRLPGLLPDLCFAHALEATRIHSVAGTLVGRALLLRPPFRAPHHTTSDAGLIGGGRPLRPGEVSLAHRGVLFLDELPEFRRPVLEALRQPLEEGVVRLVRAHGAVHLDARFQLVAAMNPCPCGYRDDLLRECACDDGMLRRYRGKLSGPLLDRIDLHVAVPRQSFEQVARVGDAPEATARVRARVSAARDRQDRRYRERSFGTNAALPAASPRAVRASDAALALLERAVDRLGLSMRGCVRTLRVARTIADLDAERDDDARLEAADLAEALALRGP